MRRALRDTLDRSTALGLALRRLRRALDRRANAGARLGNVAMLHAGRCGSSVLADQLHQRADFHWAGELFENLAPIYFRVDAARRAEELIANALHRERIPWFGFDSKILPEQHLRPELGNHSVEGYVGLLERLGFQHFILLGRRNHLRRAASIAIGTETRQWNTYDDVRRARVRLEPQRFVSYGTEMTLLQFFASLDETHDRARRALQGRQWLELEYETDIERDPRAGYDRVCAWLGLAPQAVEVRLKKLSAGSWREQIDNPDEIDRALRDTAWAWMLDA